MKRLIFLKKPLFLIGDYLVSIKAQNIWFRYPGQSQFVFESLSWNQTHSQAIGLIGTNGCGKSTFLRLIAGIIALERGKITINGKKVEGVNSTRKIISFVPENARLFLIGPTGNQDLLRIIPNSEKVRGLLTQHRLSEIAEKRLYALSEGQRRLLALFASFQLNRQILFFDEPTIGLDTESRQLFARLVHEATEAGKMVIIATNDPRLFSQVDKIVVLSNGVVKLEGSTQEILYRLEKETELVPNQLIRTISRFQTINRDFPSLVRIEDLNAYISRGESKSPRC